MKGETTRSTLHDPRPVAEEKVGLLSVLVYRDRVDLGQAAAAAVAASLRRKLKTHGAASIVFAAAPSQDEFLAALGAAEGIEWSKVTAFEVDEYAGLDRDTRGSCGRYLTDHLLSRVSPGRVNFIDGTADAAGECRRYAGLLRAEVLDLACLGIGENGHLAFNEPDSARFDDPEAVRVVATDLTSRRQQVNDGAFERLEDVPREALTLTLPSLMAAGEIHCMVPSRRKRAAIARTLHGPIEPACPASILRRHEHARLYLDVASYGAIGSA